MTTKDLHIAIKKGHGVQYMMARHHFASEDLLFEAIRNLSPLGATGFISDLKKNQKQLDKKAKRNTTADVNIQTSEDAGSEDSPEEKLNVQSSEETSTGSSEPIDDEAEMGSPVTIEQLEKDEQELSANLCKLEDEHKQMAAQRRDCMSRFGKAKKAMVELQRILRVQQENVTAIYDEYETLAAKMQDNNKERAAYMELLEVVRSQIAELRKVTVFVYESGVIEVENAKFPSIDEESLNIALTELISMPDAEEFTIKKLKTIAKVRLIVNALEQDNPEIELVFDSLEVQKFYETVTTITNA